MDDRLLALLAPVTRTERERRREFVYWLIVVLFASAVVATLLHDVIEAPGPAAGSPSPGRRDAPRSVRRSLVRAASRPAAPRPPAPPWR